MNSKLSYILSPRYKKTLENIQNKVITKKISQTPVKYTYIKSPKKSYVDIKTDLSIKETHITKILKNIDCYELKNIKNSKIIGKGSEGIAYIYCVLNKCDYVVKIQDYDEDDYKIILQEQKKTNKAHELGLAPKIYSVKACPKEDAIITVMDLVKGNTLFKQDFLLYYKKLFKTLDILHKNNITHGDLNLGNIIVDTKGNIKFIDFNTTHLFYENYYDYLMLLHFLPYIKNNKPIYQLILNKLETSFKKRASLTTTDNAFLYLLRKIVKVDSKTYEYDLLSRILQGIVPNIQFDEPIDDIDFNTSDKQIMQTYVFHYLYNDYRKSNYSNIIKYINNL